MVPVLALWGLGVFPHHIGRVLVSIVLLSIASAASYGLAAVLQHRAAVREPSELSMRAGLLVRLARRPMWLVGSAIEGVVRLSGSCRRWPSYAFRAHHKFVLDSSPSNRLRHSGHNHHWGGSPKPKDGCLKLRRQRPHFVTGSVVSFASVSASGNSRAAGTKGCRKGTPGMALLR
jgi:hypothetical protein